MCWHKARFPRPHAENINSIFKVEYSAWFSSFGRVSAKLDWFCKIPKTLLRKGLGILQSPLALYRLTVFTGVWNGLRRDRVVVLGAFWLKAVLA